MASEMSRQEIVDNVNYYKNKYIGYKNNVTGYDLTRGRYSSLKGYIQSAVDGANNVSSKTLTLMDTLNEGFIFSGNEGYGVKDLQLQSNNMKKVSANLQLLVDHCDRRMSELAGLIKQNQDKKDYYWSLYNEWSTKLGLYDRQH